MGVLLVLESLEKSLDATARIDTYTRAGFLLEEKLAELRSEESIKTGKESGEFEDDQFFRWEKEMTETVTNNLYKVTVTVKWERNKKISAVTYVRW